MPNIRVVFLWHMHQPFYKDLVSGEYRLPWVRLHGLKDYYGMVKLLDEFPGVHQTFNLVPSLIAQIQDYVSGAARDPFQELAAKPARDLPPRERRFALEYLFQANPVHMIGRYPRYQELWNMFRAAGANADRALPHFQNKDFTDLQVLSQLAWFDEFFLDDPGVAALIRKGRGFSDDDQRFIIVKQRELLGTVLPAYAAAAQKGAIEISTSPFYHPILPLLCDTDQGAVSTPGLKLPQKRFRHPEDARTQLERGLDLHERTFGVRPRGAWPSEGSVSEEVLTIAYECGLKWMATDEGVLGRTLGYNFVRDGSGRLQGDGPDKLYRVYRYDKGFTHIHLLFRDHALSDLIGFVYSGMPPHDAANNFLHRIRQSAQPVLAQGRDAVVPIILDGENAWEYYPRSGREFLRRLYDGIQRDPQMQAVTVSEVIQSEADAELPKTRAVVPPSKRAAKVKGGIKPIPRSPDEVVDRRHFARLERLVPGSWIHANFNVWIGAPEDNRAWDYLSAARDFYANRGMTATPEQRAVAFEEILIAEGSDWNWWYGPEHHTANDRDFDELYRKHLSNVYLALGARPPDYLAQPIAAATARPTFIPQTAYIHPRIGAEFERYFDWIGAAMYTADRRAGAMHGKQFLLNSVYAGIDEANVFGRLDFATVPDEFELVVNLEVVETGGAAQIGAPEFVFDAGAGSTPIGASQPVRAAAGENSGAGVAAFRLELTVAKRVITAWKLRGTGGIIADSQKGDTGVQLSLRRNFVFKVPLEMIAAREGMMLRLRFSLWQQNLPVDALPVEGWLELSVVPEYELEANLYVNR